MFFFFNLKFAFALLDVYCQSNCIKIGTGTGIGLERPRKSTCHPAREVAPDVASHLFGCALGPSLSSAGTAEPAFEDKLQGADLRILGVDDLAFLVRLSRTRAQRDQLFQGSNLSAIQAQVVGVFTSLLDKLLTLHTGIVPDSYKGCQRHTFWRLLACLRPSLVTTAPLASNC